MQDSTITPPGQLNSGITLYDGRYRIDVVLSQEPTRAVYRGWDLKNDYAVTILELVTHDLHRLQDALQKAHPLVEMQHPAISIIQSAFIEQDHFFLGFTIPGGQTIATIMAERKEAIAPASAIRWITQALDTLIFLSDEQKDWHLGDLSPSSLLVTSEDRVQVLGFDIPLGLIAPWEMAITLPNGAVAPEMFEDECTAQADVYSIAATLYFLLAHHHWQNSGDEPLATRRPDLPLTLVETVERGLADDPSDRWDDAAAFHAALLASLPTERVANSDVEGWTPPVVSLADLHEDPPTVTIHSTQLLAMDSGEFAAITQNASSQVTPLAQPMVDDSVNTQVQTPGEPVEEAILEESTENAATEISHTDAEETPETSVVPEIVKTHLLPASPALNTHEIHEFSGAIALPMEYFPPSVPDIQFVSDASPTQDTLSSNETEKEPEVFAFPEIHEESATEAYTEVTEPANEEPPSEDLSQTHHALESAALVGGGLAGIGAGFLTEHLLQPDEAPAPVTESLEPEQPLVVEPETVTIEAQQQPQIVASEPHAINGSEPVVDPEPVQESAWIVGHVSHSSDEEPVEEQYQQNGQEAAPITFPTRAALRAREGVLGKLIALLRTPSMPSLSTGTIVIPRYYYPQRSSSFLIRIQCRKTEKEQIADHVILTVDTSQEAFYFATTRLALPVPTDGAISEGTLVCTPLRPTPAGEIDTIRFRFATADGQEVHHGRAYLAEVVILPPHSRIDDTAMITLIHNLDVSVHGER